MSKRQLLLGFKDIIDNIAVFIVFNILVGSILILSTLSISALVAEVGKLNTTQQELRDVEDVVRYTAIPLRFDLDRNYEVQDFIELFESTQGVTYVYDYNMSTQIGSRVFHIIGNPKLIDPSFDDEKYKIYTSRNTLDGMDLIGDKQRIKSMVFEPKHNRILQDQGVDKEMTFIVHSFNEYLSEYHDYFTLSLMFDSLHIPESARIMDDTLKQQSEEMGFAIREVKRVDPTIEFNFLMKFNVPLVMAILTTFIVCCYIVIQNVLQLKARELNIHRICGAQRSDFVLRVGVVLLISSIASFLVFEFLNPSTITGFRGIVGLLMIAIDSILCLMFWKSLDDEKMAGKFVEDGYHDIS